MPVTNNIPLTYAVNTNGTIHLFILIYGNEIVPGFPQNGQPSGSTMLYSISNTGEGQIKHFKHYNFPIGGFTDIRVVCNNHERKMEIIDYTDNQMPVNQPDGKAFDVPYVYSQKINANQFKVEIVFIPSTAKNLSCLPSGPTNTDTSTLSSISETGTIKSILEELHTFIVTDFFNDESDNGHTIEYTGNPPRKGKTKNRNHSPTPFPSRRRKPKTSNS